MADKYVRKTGLDTNDGNSAGAAYLTIQKAVDNATTAGDTIYIGAGIYREQVDLSTGGSGSSGSPIILLADIDGSNTGDAGLVIITSYDSDTGADVRGSCIENSAATVKTFWTFTDLVLIGGTDAAYNGATASANAHEGLVFDGVTFLSGATDRFDDCVHIDFNGAASPTNNGPQFDGCIFHGGPVRFEVDNNASANIDRKVDITNSVFEGAIASTGLEGAALILETASAADTFGDIGFTVNNCTFIGKQTAIETDTDIDISGTVTVRNSYFIGCQQVFESETSASPSVIDEDYNVFGYAGANPRVNCDTGANTDGTAPPALLGGVHDAVLYRKWGWSPFRPYEPIRLQDDTYLGPLVGFAAGTGGDAPTTTDLYGSPRPMHGTQEDAGAVEGRARAEKETTTVRTGSNAIRFEGQGYQDFLVPVNAASTTVSVYGRFTGTPSTKPKMEVVNIPGVADQTDTMTGAADTWEELTATFTPTSQGVCRVRLWNQDTGSANCFFDDLTVT